MNEWLAQYFGTAPVSDDTEKQASASLFIKLAAENGIDLNAMSDAEVQELYDSTMGKVAEDDKDDEKKKKVEEAAKEHEEKKESAAKFAEAELMGQIMAHSFEAERIKIAKRGQNEPSAAAADAAAAAHSGSGGHGSVEFRSPEHTNPKLTMGEKARIMAGKAKEQAGAAGKKVVEFSKKHKTPLIAGAAGLTAGGAGLLASHAYHKSKESKKAASALDELAAEHAVTKVASAGWDADEAAQRIVSVLTLGVSDENSKVAFAQTLDEAVEVRSLELAEAAGYPVTWPTE